MAGRRKDPERAAKRAKMSGLLQKLNVGSMDDIIDLFNRQLRKVTKTKSAFVSDDALMKMLYLVTMRVTEKWTQPIKNWGTILDNLMVHFGDRVKIPV